MQFITPEITDVHHNACTGISDEASCEEMGGRVISARNCANPATRFSCISKVFYEAACHSFKPFKSSVNPLFMSYIYSFAKLTI